MEQFILSARNVREVFGRAGPAAVDPDLQTDADITRALERYNLIYEDLRINEQAYVDVVVHWLEGEIATQRKIQDAIGLALQNVHRQGILKFNTIYERATRVRKLRQTGLVDASGDIAKEVSSGTADLVTYITSIDADLKTLEDLMRTLREEILGHR
jgi:hypothetical protein